MQRQPHITNKNIQRAQTPLRPKLLTKSHPGFESGFPDWSGYGSGCLPDHSENVVDLLPCRRRSFRQVSQTSAGDSMRNAKKSPKIPYSAMVKEMEKWSGIQSGSGSTPKFNHF